METKICKKCGRELVIDNFKKTRWGGRADVCTDCAREKFRETRAKKEQQANARSLGQYTPRELMEELARRGYTGKLTYVETHTIDIENI